MIAGMVSDAEKQRIGMLIKRRRQELGVRTQADLAALVGTSKTSVAKWEAGRYYPARYLGKLEAVLGIRMDEPDGQLDFDPADRDEATIASWTVFTVRERQVKINELREAKRAARRTV